MKPRLVPVPAELEMLLRRQEYLRGKHLQFKRQFPNLQSREELNRPQRRIYERMSEQQGDNARLLDEMKKALFDDQPQ